MVGIITRVCSNMFTSSLNGKLLHARVKNFCKPSNNSPKSFTNGKSTPFYWYCATHTEIDGAIIRPGIWYYLPGTASGTASIHRGQGSPLKAVCHCQWHRCHGWGHENQAGSRLHHCCDGRQCLAHCPENNSLISWSEPSSE
jgi:hypothetical protein